MNYLGLHLTLEPQSSLNGGVLSGVIHSIILYCAPVWGIR